MSVSSVSSASLLQSLQQARFSRSEGGADARSSPARFVSDGQNLPQVGAVSPARTSTSGAATTHYFSTEMLGSLLSLQYNGADPAASLFASADLDGDGALNADELSADMAAHAPPGVSVDTGDLASRMIADGDSDGDGQLSASEFAALKPPAGGPPGGAAPGGLSSLVQTIMGGGQASTSGDGRSLDPADTNKDGKVSMSELMAALQSTQAPTSTPSSEASDMLAKLLDQLSRGDQTTPSTVRTTA